MISCLLAARLAVLIAVLAYVAFKVCKKGLDSQKLLLMFAAFIAALWTAWKLMMPKLNETVEDMILLSEFIEAILQTASAMALQLFIYKATVDQRMETDGTIVSISAQRSVDKKMHRDTICFLVLEVIFQSCIIGFIPFIQVDNYSVIDAMSLAVFICCAAYFVKVHSLTKKYSKFDRATKLSASAVVLMAVTRLVWTFIEEYYIFASVFIPVAADIISQAYFVSEALLFAMLSAAFITAARRL